mmetsp:Transcript_15157/g.29321  ORF Transcript_15157/g.29321 Transcript_15157/m.29321 type:complete len:322 (+) Transcript_15157:368-1333(+)
MLPVPNRYSSAALPTHSGSKLCCKFEASPPPELDIWRISHHLSSSSVTSNPSKTKPVTFFFLMPRDTNFSWPLKSELIQQAIAREAWNKASFSFAKVPALSPPCFSPMDCSSKSSRIMFMSAIFSPRLTARMVASFKRFSRPAPENPGVILAVSSKSSSLSSYFECPFLGISGLFFAWTSRILKRFCLDGVSMKNFLSNLPGLSKASSRSVAMFVAPITRTRSVGLNPSISIKSCSRPCSLSCTPGSSEKADLRLPRASISSMNMMEGEFARAVLKMCFTLSAAIPSYISTNSAPLHAKKGTLNSPAKAFASMVLPVPGGP